MQTDSYYPVFQPLIQLATGHTVGYEALLRSRTNESPEVLFQAARSAGRLYELDVWSVQRAVASYFADPILACGGPLLFVFSVHFAVA